MKNLNLEAFDVQGMTKQEMTQTNGGGIIAGVLIAAAFWLLSEFDDIKQGCLDAHNNKEYNYQR